MSTVDLDAIRQRIKHAHDEVCGLCNGSRKWTMRIPAQPERDSDLVISAALADAEALIAEVERLRAANANLIRNSAVLADEVVYAHAQRATGEDT